MKKIPSLKDYSADKEGNIYSTKFKKTKKLKQSRDKDGYARVSVMINKSSKNRLVHRLLAITFISNPHNKPEINHKDGDKSNNKLDNLEWVTRSENALHAVKYLGMKSPMKGIFGEKNHASKPIRQYTIDGIYLQTFSSLHEAGICNDTSSCHIGAVASGKRRTAGGYIWKWK